MLLKITAIAGLALCAQLASAAEAGKVIFVAGKAQVLERQAAEGAAVQEGDMLETGADGFLYIKTVDNGLFILRPNTKARIVTYHVDAKNPSNTRIKLDLISGVARSRSGDAVKQARQNFRFNTPVAAIGVRGTDFTVFTDENTSRVSVISGGIVVSGFAGACSPEGSGPCEGASSRELSAAQRGQLLQIKRGSSAPQLMSGGVVTPDAPSPVGAPLGSNSSVSEPVLPPSQPNFDAQKTVSLNQAKSQIPPVVPPAPPVVPGPDVSPAPVEQGIVWGRWQPLMFKAPTIDLAAEKANAELLAVNGNFALFRTPGREYVSPEKGSVGFTLRDGEAYVYTDYGTTRFVEPATMNNAKLNVDFGARSFATSMDLVTSTELFSLQATGTLSRDGRMYGDSSGNRIGSMDVQGVLSNDKNGSASYIFNSRIDDKRSANGVTFWRQ